MLCDFFKMATMNSSLSKSQSLANLGSLKLQQVQLIDWAATWTKSSDLSIPSMSVDMPDIVTLLQAVGYKLRNLEAHAPHDIANISTSSGSSDINAGQERGVRVVVTCCHSGQVCVLEAPLAANKCRCSKVPDGDISDDCFWEVTALGGGKSKSNPTLIESGCDALPSVSKEVNILVANVLNYLCDRIIGNKELEQLEIPLKETPVSSKFGRFSDSVTITTRRGTGNGDDGDLTPLSTLEKFRKAPSVAVSSPHQDGNDSPARYRSLDTLISVKAEKILPEPGHLVAKDPEDIQKSMDLLSVEDPQESSTSTIGETSFNSSDVSKLKEVHKLIRAISSSVEDKKFNASILNKLNEVYKMIGEITSSTRDNHLNSTNMNKLKKLDKIIGDMIKKVDRNDTSMDKDKRKSNSASNIIQKIMRGPKLPTSAQARAKVTNSSPNLQSAQFVPPRAIGTIKKRRIGSSSSNASVDNKAETVKRRPVVRSSTDVSTKQPIDETVKKSLKRFANVKSTIPKPEPSKRKD